MHTLAGIDIEQVATSAPTVHADIRIMTHNILFGWKWGRVLDLIRFERPDIICLQEVPHRDHRLGGAPPERIIDDLQLPNAYEMLWGAAPNAIGNMTLVRGGVGPGEILKVRWTRPYGIANRVETCGVRLTVANVHLSPMKGPPPLTFLPTEIARFREARDLSRRFATIDTPAVALGDFNTFHPAPGCWVMNRGWTDCRRAAGGRHGATRPTYGLPFVIDHIFTRGHGKVLDYRVIESGASDHRAVIATVRFSRNSGQASFGSVD
ncbi:MAG: endonuclease/exonuclease/phosphatase family protein [Planctomycetota bacterium]|nr:endonuclease/exonuclease/phosphatase family protein [Planctomycetota bacterium]